MPAGAAPPLPDLLLLARYYGSPPDAPAGGAAGADAARRTHLHNAAQTLLAALLRPGGAWRARAEAAGSPEAAWPPAAASRLASLLRRHRMRQGAAAPVPLQQLRDWKPQVVVAAVACVSHAARAPAGMVGAGATGLTDYLLRLAPSEDSCMAGELLGLALMSGEWDAWRPHVGGVAPVLER